MTRLHLDCEGVKDLRVRAALLLRRTQRVPLGAEDQLAREAGRGLRW